MLISATQICPLELMCRISFNFNDGRIAQITLIIKVINSFKPHHDEIFQYKLVPKPKDSMEDTTRCFPRRKNTALRREPT
ncbi:hypothetical protein CEXT_299861 [Caerostris extrusa]|uniref:Uncharacterized protein n=1 Tax=Caerostris extrusa TaxID=172846 RepID=A0AAV4UJ25_CAEEX|nr:hypothetical protein CEXT_299861 [Caerostris extrusa]